MLVCFYNVLAYLYQAHNLHTKDRLGKKALASVLISHVASVLISQIASMLCYAQNVVGLECVSTLTQAHFTTFLHNYPLLYHKQKPTMPLTFKM